MVFSAVPELKIQTINTRTVWHQAATYSWQLTYCKDSEYNSISYIVLRKWRGNLADCPPALLMNKHRSNHQPWRGPPYYKISRGWTGACPPNAQAGRKNSTTVTE